MRVLLSAFACAPGYGSEPNVGWNVARQVATRHETWVLTDAANQRHVAAVLAADPAPNLHFVFVSVPRGLSCTAAVGWRHYVHYTAWQLRAYAEARRLQRAVGFDLVHHVTYVNSWLPTWMGRLGIPFIWSAGGRDQTPRAFLRSMSWRSRAAELTRNAAISVLGAVDNRLVASRASLILTASDVARWPPGLPVQRFAVGGLDVADLASLRAIPERRAGPFRVVSIGRLLGLKGFAIALEAFAHLHEEHPRSEYWIVGEGPERPYLENLARKLGCADAVCFLGWLPREEVLRRLAGTDVLVHPSLHEQFGYVLLEAMAAGRPVVCLGIGGPAEVVRPGHGFAIKPEGPLNVVDALHCVLRRMALDPNERLEMGRRARDWVTERWSWEAVGRRILSLYDEVVSHRAVACS